MQARPRQELRPATSRRTSRSDVENDVVLLQKLRTLPPIVGLMSCAPSASEGQALSPLTPKTELLVVTCAKAFIRTPVIQSPRVEVE
jgi:hypothetical protein